VGSTVHYSFNVTNPGDTPLSVQFSDPKCDALTLTGPTGDTSGNGKLDITETWTYGCTHVVVTGDGDPVHNTAVVIGTDSLGGNDSDTDSVDVDIPNVLAPPALTPIDNSAQRSQCIKKAKKKFKTNPARKKAIAKCRKRFP
jgi:hypothetical protein